MKKQLLTFLDILRYCLSSGRLLTVFLFTVNILWAFLNTLQVWLTGQIVRVLTEVLSADTRLTACLPYVAGWIAALLAIRLITAAIPYERSRLYARVQKKMMRDLMEAVNRIPAVCQEGSEEQMRIGRALEFVNRRFDSSFRSMIVLVSGFASMVSVLVLLGGYSLVFPLVSVATSLPIVLIRLKQDQAMYAMYQKQYPANQLGSYFLNSLTTKDSLIELEIFGAKELFLDRYQAITRENIRQRTRYFIQHVLHGNLFESLLILSGNIFLILYALYLLTARPELYQIDMLSVVISGVMSAQEAVIGFAFNGKYIAEATMYGSDFWELIRRKTDTDKAEPADGPHYTLELKDVSFRYPNRENNQLEGINLTLRAGETVGIVGENGSGKSTLSKVILGLYAPLQGEIRVDGILTPPSGPTFDRVSSVFQDYVRYELTAGENIWFGAPHEEPEEENIRRAAGEADADGFIGQLPMGYETPLGSLLPDSVQLSGGQWQKLAVARGFYARGSLLVLDEPNASMDVMTEASVYRQYYEQIRGMGRIGILISHRLGSTRFCDRILVLKDGRIVQDGSFEELIHQDGLYKSMYEAQSQWYHAGNETEFE